ncbi:MAG: hypothetical protein WA884_11965 [Methyloceanibacter sp.]
MPASSVQASGNLVAISAGQGAMKMKWLPGTLTTSGLSGNSAAI